MPKLKTKSLENVASTVGESEERVLEKSLESYIGREIREAELRIREIKRKYGVGKPSGLKEKIENEEIEGHPAWEELIEWENLEKRVEELESL
ncbi:MAG: hypothetical protein SVV03_04980 [Candidatus Nanohaloarchaea archaeon]|nr:hypothetical protein [Candidatus Nanohaloarchaea archaeon]